MKRWQFWLGLIISAVMLFYVLYQLPLAQMWDSIRTAQYLWLIPAVTVYFIGVWARTWRWHYLLRPIKPVSLRTLFPVLCIGYMGNNIYPARAGDLVLRPYLLRQKEGIPFSATLATVFIERIFDGVVMLIFIFVNLTELAKLTGESGFVGNIQQVAIIGTALFFGAFLVFLLAAMFPARSERIIDWFIRHLTPARVRPQLEGVTHRFLDGLACLRSRRDTLMVFVTSILVWLFETGKYWFLMHAFSFPVPVSFFALMLMNGIVNLATTLPSAPGYIGTFDAPGIKVLEAYGVAAPVATAYTLVLHAALWFPITALGAWFMLRQGLSLSKVRAEVEEAA